MFNRGKTFIAAKRVEVTLGVLVPLAALIFYVLGGVDRRLDLSKQHIGPNFESQEIAQAFPEVPVVASSPLLPIPSATPTPTAIPTPTPTITPTPIPNPKPLVETIVELPDGIRVAQRAPAADEAGVVQQASVVIIGEDRVAGPNMPVPKNTPASTPTPDSIRIRQELQSLLAQAKSISSSSEHDSRLHEVAKQAMRLGYYDIAIDAAISGIYSTMQSETILFVGRCFASKWWYDSALNMAAHMISITQQAKLDKDVFDLRIKSISNPLPSQSAECGPS